MGRVLMTALAATVISFASSGICGIPNWVQHKRLILDSKIYASQATRASLLTGPTVFGNTERERGHDVKFTDLRASTH